MIQRIQTLYLLLGVFTTLAVGFLPLAEILLNELPYTLTVNGVDGVKNGFSIPIMKIFMGMAITFNILAIFTFKQLKKQQMLSKLGIFSMGLLLVSMLFYVDLFTDVESHVINYKFFSLIPAIGIVGNILAIRGIKKDQDLLSSYNRLR